MLRLTRHTSLDGTCMKKQLVITSNMAYDETFSLYNCCTRIANFLLLMTKCHTLYEHFRLGLVLYLTR